MANKVEEEELCWGKILEELMNLLFKSHLSLSEAALELLLIVYVMKNISTLLTFVSLIAMARNLSLQETDVEVRRIT